MRNNSQLGRVLAIVEDDELRCGLQQMLRDSVWKLEPVRNIHEAVETLLGSEIGVVVAGRKCWKCVLKETRWMTPPPRVIVVDRLATDELWLEVLQHGAYDLIAQPLERREVLRMLALAWVSWCDEEAAIGTASLSSPR